MINVSKNVEKRTNTVTDKQKIPRNTPRKPQPHSLTYLNRNPFKMSRTPRAQANMTLCDTNKKNPIYIIKDSYVESMKDENDLLIIAQSVSRELAEVNDKLTQQQREELRLMLNEVKERLRKAISVFERDKTRSTRRISDRA